MELSSNCLVIVAGQYYVIIILTKIDHLIIGVC
ncbi:Uncharacterised protein [Sphingobacterium spiritivorum]|nr:Uncharacterised protein [Sphingobacterium spiritivorum]